METPCAVENDQVDIAEPGAIPPMVMDRKHAHCLIRHRFSKQNAMLITPPPLNSMRTPYSRPRKVVQASARTSLRDRNHLSGRIIQQAGAATNGMVMDCSEVKSLAKTHLVDEWDHAFSFFRAIRPFCDCLDSMPGHKTVILDCMPSR